MKLILRAAAGACLIAVGGCGGQGDDSLGENAADVAEEQAETLDAAAENATNEVAEENLEAQADALREAGERKKEAIDEADVNADDMTAAQKNAVANGM
jgi:transcription antitermination factor NusA-like protein